MATNTDHIYLEDVKSLAESFQNRAKELLRGHEDIDYPLSQNIFNLIGEVHIQEDDSEYEIFKYQDKLNNLWSKLISSSIIALRFFDKREPFSKEGVK